MSFFNNEYDLGRAVHAICRELAGTVKRRPLARRIASLNILRPANL
jgi:hypothetical protein